MYHMLALKAHTIVLSLCDTTKPNEPFVGLLQIWVPILDMFSVKWASVCWKAHQNLTFGSKDINSLLKVK